MARGTRRWRAPAPRGRVRGRPRPPSARGATAETPRQLLKPVRPEFKEIEKELKEPGKTKPVLFPEVRFYTNDSWGIIRGVASAG